LIDDDEDIMQVEYMPNNIPSGKVASPVRSDSSGRIEAHPNRRSPSPPIDSNFDVRLADPVTLTKETSTNPFSLFSRDEISSQMRRFTSITKEGIQEVRAMKTPKMRVAGRTT